MTKEQLIKELELLADSCDSNYALEMNGYNRGVLDALELVNKYFVLAPVSGRSEQLATFVQWLEDNHSIKIHDMIVVDYIRYGG